MGRHRSVAGTTSRRCPSVRMRPGAGYLPTLALGRPRGRTTEPLCVHLGVAPAGPPEGASPVMLLRPSPRPPYRIYSEEEFLAAEDCQVEVEPGFGEDFEPARELTPAPGLALLGRTGPRCESKRWGGLAALAALASVVAAVVGVVALNATRSQPRSDRRFAGRVVAGGGSPPGIVAARPSTRSFVASSRKPTTKRASVSIRRITGREPRSIRWLSITAHLHRRPQPTPPAETASASTASEPATRPTATRPTTAPARTAPATTAPTTAATVVSTTATPAVATASTPVATAAATAATPSVRGAGAEFGFERR